MHLGLCLFYSAVVFYSPSWIKDYYSASEVGVSVNTSTVLSICCVCLAVNFLALIINKLSSKSFQLIFIILLGASQFMMAAAYFMGLKSFFKIFSEPIFYAVGMLLANLAAELVPLIIGSSNLGR